MYSTLHYYLDGRFITRKRLHTYKQSHNSAILRDEKRAFRYRLCFFKQKKKIKKKSHY
jgi:hypothetical protein